MTRADALAVWQDLTRELWPEADVEKSALRIEHQEHVDWLLSEMSDYYADDDTNCVGCDRPIDSLSINGHAPDCGLWLSWQALDDVRGHGWCGWAFDLGRATPMGQWAEGAEGTLFSIDPASYNLYRGPISIEQALLRGPFPTSASMEARVAATQRLVDEGILTQEQADDLAMGR